jgi:hypothetical protein
MIVMVMAVVMVKEAVEADVEAAVTTEVAGVVEAEVDELLVDSDLTIKVQVDGYPMKTGKI